ncbi:tight adherence protein B [Rhizobium sp. PP-F2F-G38]|uniref:Type II secretion system F family protein n=1 Tax=Ferranicluibacter rubi TaxID=2715133 RepID=A0AA43ZD40_9HYPH|nr:type II secretion system F family protein [Ferranicluibacter rubi]PYE35054.1 tight adherence protein B [Rhizobium sp. PP-WC-1G-195]PYE98860.1 tight adherence protein B [Rhizobium sp. PP-F2F-G38]TCP89679.1 tight adherence protein B [Rhizobium sp. PP-CC-2G-626]TCQ11449.1 tight adherence protein B [Rhizobium sp. PP-F2F-G36]TCQ29779.1 tight adherence protein B [Rhizobium sp. PP-CC-3G-465]
MFGLDPLIIAIAVLAAISTAGLGYGFLFSRIQDEKNANARFRKIKAAETDRVNIKAARDRMNELSKRRKSVQDSLKDLQKKQKEKSARAKPPIKVRLTQAGLSISITQFYVFSGILGFVAFLVALIVGGSFLIALGIMIFASLGLPRWIVGFLVNRRCKKFIEEFPNSLEVMVRSIKSGLPLSDAIRLIASDGQEPVKTEFRRVIDAQGVGMTVPEACTRMIQTVPLQEVNFFSVVITIQGQAGGNLSEALSNLAKVLRERRKMKAKVQALSMEAKASACIIGALPFIVTLLVYLSSPDYIMVLFTDPRGHLIMGISAIWMSMGIFVMRQMINFDM